jgi:hypothetical protein
MQIVAMAPVYGDNYTLGDIGFQFVDDSFISNGIVYFTGWEAMSKIKVSHSFVITGPDTCEEALAEGVVESNLQPRFLDKHTHVTIRRPVNLDIQRGIAIKKGAEELQGKLYDFALIGGMVTVNSRLVRWLPTKVYVPYRTYMTKMFHTIGRLICAGVSVKALSAVAEYAAVLTHPYYYYDPQLLFENGNVFKIWKHQHAT